ncbi:MAG: transposase [bacterium]|nr:transposase [bacterium]
MPSGVEGEFGPGIKSLVCTLKNVSNITEPKIKEFFENFGIYISSATISRILTKDNEPFHQEKADIFQAGLSSTVYQQIDDTTARVKGQNHYTQVVCNPYYTSYFTGPHKDRLSILDILQGDKARSYYFNEEAFALMKTFRLSKKVFAQLREAAQNKIFTEDLMQKLLASLFPNPGEGKNQRTRIMEASAIAAYHNQTDFPVVEALLSDDAPQYKQITREQGLCWVHDGRHYKKLRPVVPLHQQKLEEFKEQYWNYYRKLLQYKENPTQEKAEKLSTEFDELFSTQTNYQALDDRIAKSKDKKSELLLVLKYPELPLHNNDAELGARAQVRKRDVSLHTMTEEGTKANDTFLTIVQTAKKLGVRAYEYIYDRVSKNFHLPSLSSLIRETTFPGIDCFDPSYQEAPAAPG